MKIITWLLFTFICLLPAGSMAQNKVTLSGKITDQHGTPVAQATIAVENTTSGTYTDAVSYTHLTLPTKAFV